jgi:thioredoxin-dependent peroxiredoxin
MALKTGDRAPEFSLAAGDGTTVSLSDFRGKKTVVLFFYPKDDTPGCTREACDFRDGHGSFQAAGAEVIGVSADSVESHQRFAEKHGLPMKLLSDRDGAVRAAYGVKSTLGLIPGRVTFVIDREGVVRYVYSSQILVHNHVQKALEVVRGLEKGAAQPSL